MGLFGVIVVLLLAGTMGCGSSSRVASAHESSAVPGTQEFRDWQIIHVRSGTAVAFEDLIGELADQDVIYLGEEHHNRFHIQSAIKVLQALLGRGRRPVLTMEMFAWDGQAALDRYLSDETWSREAFLDEVRWKDNWGGAFKDYEPLVDVARDHHLVVVAMNPPRQLVRKVAKQGLTQAATDPEMERWGMRDEPIVDVPAYRELILGQLRACHAGMPDAAYERIYEASMFRDEGMAKTISTYLETSGPRGGPVLSYTGAGHIQQKLPVPDRVSRRRSGAITQATIYMASLEPDHPEYVAELLKDNVADYVWLTPLGEHGPPRRCG